MNYQVEITRNNVTLAQFFAAVRATCKAKGIDFCIDREEFESPQGEGHTSYRVIDGIKKCYFEEYRTHTNYRRKTASYTTPDGFTRHYYTDELEEYQETKLECWSNEQSAEDAPCEAETSRQFAHDTQTYILNFDGSMYNEICEFTFWNDKIGTGYYYQANKD